MRALVSRLVLMGIVLAAQQSLAQPTPPTLQPVPAAGVAADPGQALLAEKARRPGYRQHRFVQALPSDFRHDKFLLRGVDARYSANVSTISIPGELGTSVTAASASLGERRLIVAMQTTLGVSSAAWLADRFIDTTPLGDGRSLVVEYSPEMVGEHDHPLLPDAGAPLAPTSPRLTPRDREAIARRINELPPPDFVAPADGAGYAPFRFRRDDGPLLFHGGPTLGDAVIDVLVIYPDALRSVPVDVLGTVDKAVASSNAVLATQQLPTSVRVVAVQPLRLTYSVEDGLGSLPMLDALSMMLDQSEEGLLVPYLADRHKADVVIFLVARSKKDRDACGLSPWWKGRGPHTFNRLNGVAVVDYGCSARHLSLLHEIGHLVGANHDHKSSLKPTLKPYAHGAVHPNTGDYTVMARRPEICSTSCSRLPIFSSPNTRHDGVVLGHADTADNLRMWRTNAPIVAAYR